MISRTWSAKHTFTSLPAAESKLACQREDKITHPRSRCDVPTHPEGAGQTLAYVPDASQLVKNKLARC